MDINKSIDHFMRKLDLNQSQLARAAGMDVSTLSLIINNHRDPNMKTLTKIATACDVKVSEFIAAGEEDSKTQFNLFGN